MRTSNYRRSSWKTAAGALAFCACGLAICAVLFRVSKTYPLEALVFAGAIALAACGVVLYIGHLYVLGWVMDFLDAIGRPKRKTLSVPLECEQVGEAIVVLLRDNIANVDECKSVERQLKRVIDEHYCDFVLDFSAAGRISTHFRPVMVNLMKAARREAENLGRPYQPIALPRGELFPVFEDSQHALAAMVRHGGHGWVVLCGVPVGVRAVSD